MLETTETTVTTVTTDRIMATTVLEQVADLNQQIMEIPILDQFEADEFLPLLHKLRETS